MKKRRKERVVMWWWWWWCSIKRSVGIGGWCGVVLRGVKGLVGGIKLVMSCSMSGLFIKGSEEVWRVFGVVVENDSGVRWRKMV